MARPTDPVLQAIIEHLKVKYRCHTAILYGSRARGEATATSDYDVIGIQKTGAKTRIARKQAGFYWDVYVYPEKELRKLEDFHLVWRDAKILFAEGDYGKNLLRRIAQRLEKPYLPIPQYERDAIRVWSQKALARCRGIQDIHALYRRSELHTAAVEHYFLLRKRRFPGPKTALLWLSQNDIATYELFTQVYKNPENAPLLKRLVARVYGQG